MKVNILKVNSDEKLLDRFKLLFPKINILPERLQANEYNKIQNQLIEFYNSRPEEYGMSERSQSIYNDYTKYVNTFVDNESKKRLLDVGSGNWRIPVTHGRYGYKEVVGIDYFSSNDLEEYSGKIKRKNVKIVTYKNKRIPFEDNYFDVVSSLCVLEHIVSIEKTLEEIDRVLKPGGIHVIQCPNWSSPLVMVLAISMTLFKKGRLNQYENILQSTCGLIRSLVWYLEVLMKKKPHFIRITPRLKNGKINFEKSDDDVVHVCQPLSFKKYFKLNNYKLLVYNRWNGTTPFTKVFNTIFPSFASTNTIVVKKSIGKDMH